MNGWQRAGRAALEVLFPPQCAGCPEVGREPFCRLCAEALVDAAPFEIPGAAAAAAAFAYGGPVAEAVQRLKYQGEWALGRALGEAMAARLPWPVDVVVPVPLARDRLVARGYNQARELARGFARPAVVDALARAPGAPQVGLSRAARLDNVRAALSPGPGRERVRDRRVLLLDDVVTTGATAEAATAALTSAGARAVFVYALAYAEPA